MSVQDDLNQLTNLTSTQGAGTQNFLAGQNETTADYLKRYSDLISSQGTTSAMAERIGQELGLPNLQKNAFQLQQQVYDLPGMQTKSMLGYDINESQRQRVINQKLSELSPLAERATAQQQFAEGQLGTRLGYAQSDWARQLMPMQTEKDLLSEHQAREVSLYTADNERELSALITKINAGITLSEGERNRAQQLSIAEKGYQNELDKLKAGTSDRYKSMGAGGLYDTLTGKIIKSGTGAGQSLDDLWNYLG